MALAAGQPEPTDTVSAARPRHDVPPVIRATAPDPVASRPPDQSGLGLVQAGLMSGQAAGRDPAPERTLKPWGVAMLPDTESLEARRAAEADRAAEDEAARAAGADDTAARGALPAPEAADTDPAPDAPRDGETPPAPF